MYSVNIRFTDEEIAAIDAHKEMKRTTLIKNAVSVYLKSLSPGVDSRNEEEIIKGILSDFYPKYNYYSFTNDNKKLNSAMLNGIKSKLEKLGKNMIGDVAINSIVESILSEQKDEVDRVSQSQDI